MQVQRPEDDELDLRTYVAVLRRRWKAVVAVIAIAVVLAITLSIQQDSRYRAESDILIRQRSTESLFTEDRTPTNAQEAERQLNNEVQFLESGSVIDAVEAAYDGPLDPEDVKASVSSDTSDVVTVTMTATDPDEAARLVNIYVDTFIEARRDQRVEELLAAGEEIRTQIDEIGSEATVTRQPLTDLEIQLAADPDDDALAARIADLSDELAGELSALQGRQDFYEQQLEQLDLTARIASSGGAQVLTAAEPPTDAVSPKPVRDAGIAVLLGLVLGVGAAFVLDNLDERIRGMSDIERATNGRPVLSLIPEAEGRVEPTYVAARDEPRAPVAEAFRSLRTSIKFAAIDRTIKVIQVTSPAAGEGKTTTVANLAMTLAQGGDRVVVVCSDLRRPTLHERFGLNPVPGFTDVLVGDTSLSNALRRCDGVMVLPAGSHAPNPSELLSTSRASNVIAALGDEFDFVILDSTPVLPVTDSLVVSRLVDATLVVADARSTRRNAIKRSLQLLDQVNAPVLGIVLNGIPASDSYGYSYGGYGYGYGGDDEVDDSARRPRRKPAGEPTPA